MRLIPLSGVASVAVAAFLYLPAAMAQPPQTAAVQGATPPPPAAAASPMAGHPVPGKTAEERVERRIKELHSQLQITPAEEPQWNEFAQVMRENARDMDQACSPERDEMFDDRRGSRFIVEVEGRSALLLGTRVDQHRWEPRRKRLGQCNCRELRCRSRQRPRQGCREARCPR